MCSTYAAVKKSNCKAGQWMVIPGGGGGVGSMVPLTLSVSEA